MSWRRNRIGGRRSGWWGRILLVIVIFVVGGVAGAAIGSHGFNPAATVRAAQSPNSTRASSSGRSSSDGVSTVNGVPVPAAENLAIQAIQKVDNSAVEVINVGTGLGSGVIMSSDGYIVTNNHVVNGAHQIQVVLTNGKKVGAKLVGVDPYDDLAVIKISPPSKLTAARFGNSSDLRVGQTVLAIGNPLGIENTATEGIVSAVNRTVAEGQNTPGSILHAIQTSAAINPGNSGGALINLAGQVVGIPTLTAVDPEFNAPASGVGFAIPSNTVTNIASQLKKYGKVLHSGRAALGISVVPTPITPQIAQQNNLPVDHGLLIHQVTSGGPADKAGIRANDIIVSIGGTTVTSYNDLLTALANKKPGDKIKVTVVNAKGQQHTYDVTLGELNVNGNT